MRKGPTKKQTALLEFIARYTEEHDFSPSYREIMSAMNLRSVSAVAEHINNCVRAGYLEKLPNQARTLRIIPIETHEETVNFFNQKLAELDRELALLEDNYNASVSKIDLTSSENTLKAAQKSPEQLKKAIATTEEQINTLRRAADILDIEL